MERTKVLTFETLPDFCSPQLVADYLGISRGRVYEFCQLKPEAGGLPSFTIGKSRKIEKSDLRQWVERRKQVGH